MKTPGLKFILYARKSSESEDRQIQSIDDQISTLKAKAAIEGVQITHIITESKSAKSPNSRPEFERLMKAIEAGKFDGLYAWSINRISRNPIDSARVQWLLQERKLKKIVTIDRDYNPEDNALLFSVESGIANQFIIDLRKSTMRGTRSKLEKGHVPYLAPQGYINDSIAGTAVPDTERFELVRKMWTLLLTGEYTVARIADIANDNWGYRTRKSKRTGGRRLAIATLHKIFNSQFYAGLIPYGEEIFAGQHDAMITLDEFDRAQEILARRGKPRPQKHRFPFTGIIQCGECGCMITAETKRKTLASGAFAYYDYYKCSNKKPGTKCSQRKVIPAEQMTSMIESGLSKFEILPIFKQWALEILEEQNEAHIGEQQKIRASQQNRMNEAIRERDKLSQALIKEMVTDEFYIATKADLDDQILRLKSRIESAETNDSHWRSTVEDVFTLAVNVRSAFKSGHNETKRHILATVGAKHMLLNGELYIQAHEWLVPISEHYTAIEESYLLGRTEENAHISFNEAKKGAFAPSMNSWYTTVNDVRTAIRLSGEVQDTKKSIF